MVKIYTYFLSYSLARRGEIHNNGLIQLQIRFLLKKYENRKKCQYSEKNCQHSARKFANNLRII